MMSVHIVIVTYNPDVDVVKFNVGNLLRDREVQKIHIIDNTPEGANLNNILSECVDVHNLYKNLGIATAQNIGIQRAIEDGAKYVALFDQDSTLSSDLISGLVKAMEIAKSKGFHLACIGPRPLDVFSGKKYKATLQRELGNEDGITICRQIIASGKLIDISALNEIGFMEDDLFIDAVDHEWCWRAQLKGYTVAISENSIMTHALGDSRSSILGLEYRVGSPIRLYYQFRNILVLSRRSYVPLYWKIRGWSSILIRFFIFGFFHNDSGIRRKYMFRGVLDGFLMKLGVYED